MSTTSAATFGTLLRRHRVAAGLTQEELAERSGLSARTISDLERGLSRSPRPESLRLLSDALQLTEAKRRELLAAVHPEVSQETAATADARRSGGVSTATLPDWLAPLIGRERELEKIVTLLDAADSRMITLTGPGGSAKRGWRWRLRGA